MKRTNHSSERITSKHDINSDLSASNNNSVEQILNIKTDTNASEKKSDRQMAPSQETSVSAVLSSSPTTMTTMVANNMFVLSHYYPVVPYVLSYQQHVHHGVLNMVVIQTPMHVPYPGAHHAIDDPSTLLVTFSPALGSGKYQYFGCPSFPVGLLSCHPSLEPPHVLPSSMSGFHVAHFEATNVLQHLSAAFSATYTSNTYCSSSNYYSINGSRISNSCPKMSFI
ncbi:unnamed protein product [Rotaria socialis]|uniref:Uncharacterized protein n=1 Tax=Rotaria socialis TaxID=392032 RepID=A0A820TLX0_9BILA|nr:unnamed protein product [Rotaria socialis]